MRRPAADERSDLNDQRGFKGSTEHLSQLLRALNRNDLMGWEAWRRKHGAAKVNLRAANLAGTDLTKYDLRGADLSEARLDDARMWDCRLDGADLRWASLNFAILNYAHLRGAKLEDAHLFGANLTDADLRGAHLNRARLIGATLNGVALQGADLRGAAVMGVSVWGVETDDDTKQTGLIVNLGWWDLGQWVVDFGPDQAPVKYDHLSVDDLETAHFISQIVNNPKLTKIIDAATGRTVLLLGRFTGGRRKILDAMKQKLLQLRYAPVVFDFPGPRDRDKIETVTGLAWLSRFVIADLTAPRSTPLEAHAIVPHLMVPFASVIEQGQRRFALFADLQRKYPWVLPTVSYRSGKQLAKYLETAVVDQAEALRRRLRAGDADADEILPVASTRRRRKSSRGRVEA